MKCTVGLDLGSDSIKIVEAFEKKGKISVRKVGLIRNPYPNFRNNLNEPDQKTLAALLKELLKERGVEARETAVGLSGQDVIIHYFDIPDMAKKEIESAVQLEALQVIPGGIEKLEYDYQIMSSSGRKTVLFAGYQKEKSDYFVNTLVLGGMKPLVMDLDALALVNCYWHVKSEPEPLVCIINVGRKYTNLAVAEKGGFIFVRDIEFGGDRITASLARSRQMTLAEAEEFKKTDEGAGYAGETARQESQDMIQEVVIGRKYFETRTQRKPDRFLLTGGTAILPGFLDEISKGLGIPGEVWNPLPEAAGDAIAAEWEGKGSEFAVALGLAARRILG